MLLKTILVAVTHLEFHSGTASFIAGNHCIRVKNDIYKNCTKKQRHSRYLYAGIKPANSLLCYNIQPRCQHMNFTRIKGQIFGVRVGNLFSTALKECCGQCASYSFNEKYIRRVDQIDEAIFNSSDVILPVFAFKSDREIFGFHFIPVLEAPGAYYITLKSTKSEDILTLMKSCLGTWPLIVICLLLSCVSGFVLWCIERRGNTSEFPKRFHEGLYQGFWWSFVSMTTVGYGDKVPRSFSGRMFSVLWILIGITIFAILTGSLTNRIMSIQSPPTPDMNGKRVGGLAHKLNDATIISQNGGALHDIEFKYMIAAIFRLVDQLVRKEIDGFLLSKPAYFYFETLTTIPTYKSYKKYRSRREKYDTLPIDITEKNFIGEKMAIGVLLKNHVTYTYFKKYFEDNWLTFQNCMRFSYNDKVNRLVPKSQQQLLGSGGTLSYTFIYFLLGVLGVLFCMGMLYERGKSCWKNRRKKKSRDEVFGKKVKNQLI